MGGLGRLVYLALLDDVASMPAGNDVEGTTAAAVANYTGNIVMKSGKYFTPFLITYDMGGFVATGQGETDGLSYRGTLTLPVAGQSDESRAFLHANKHEDFICIAPDKNGFQCLLGDLQNPVKMEAASASGFGTNAAEKNGSMIQLYVNLNNPAPGYTGTIPLAPSSGSASSGS